MILARTIQCRDGSTRLKHKSVRPFYRGKSILEIIIERLKSSGMKNIFVLTTENSPKTQEQANNMGIRVFTGDEDDVHSRFCDFAIRYQPEGVIRICADNPFISVGLMYPIESFGKSGIFDYVSYENAMQRHEGLFCEYISEHALMDMKRKPLITKYEKKHVSAYIYNHPEEYNIQTLPIPPIIDTYPVRLTVDTAADFKMAQKVYRRVKEGYWGDIYNYIFDKPYLLDKMKKLIEDSKNE